MLTSIIGMVVLLGGLIFFHELGHYSVAKFFKVKVETFSLGFGKKIFKKKWGETEYCLSLFPLGGYVKMMGDDPFAEVPADQAARAFSTQALYKRFAIVAAGPIANLLLAYVLFMVVFWVGQPQMSSQVGSVQVDSPTWNAGLRSGDRIVNLNGEAVTTWQEVEGWLRSREGQTVEVSVLRKNEPVALSLPIDRVKSKNAFGEDEWVGGLKGASPNPVAAAVGISNPKSIAALSGLQTGDLITEVEGTKVTSFDELKEVINQKWKPSSQIALSYQRGIESKKAVENLSATLQLPASASQDGLSALGMFPSETFVRQVSKDSPASKAGLLEGDRILQIAEQPVFYFDAVVDAIQKSGIEGGSVKIQIEREGLLKTLEITPVETTQEDPVTQQTYKKYMIGFAPFLVYQEPDLTTVRVTGLGALIHKAFSETNDLAKKMVLSLGKLATGSISIKNLGGPVLIATVAGKSLDAGLVQFLQMMALISINLFLLNLFPVPVLDGGHLLFFTIEAIKGKPVTVRTMEIANQIGMVFILTLVVLTLFNDISRILLH